MFGQTVRGPRRPTTWRRAPGLLLFGLISVVFVAACAGTPPTPPRADATPETSAVDAPEFDAPALDAPVVDAPSPDVADAGEDGAVVDARCTSATRLTETTTLRGQQIDALAGGGTLCGARREEPAVYFRVAIPAGAIVRVTATPAPGAAVAVRLSDGCAGVQCLGSASATAGAPATLEYTNSTGAALEAALLVSAPGLTTGMATFDLTVTLAGSATNTRCTMPERVVAGARVMGVSNALASETETSCVPDALGGLLYYQIDVGPGATLDVTAQASTSGSVGVRLLASCGGACLAGATGEARWRNDTGAMQTVLVAVGTTRREVASLGVAFDVIEPVPGATCDLAVALTLPSTTAVTIPSTASARLCDGTDLPTRWYRVAVPAGQILTATTSGAAGVQLRALRGGCTAAMCAATSASGTLLLPPQPTADTVLLAASAAGGAAFTLQVTSATPDPTSCASAMVYTASAVVTGLLADAREAATLCSAGTLPALYYRVVVAPGQRLLATSTSYYDAPIAILGGCGTAATCAGTSDDYGRSQRFANDRDTPQTVVVAVGRRPSTLTTSFTLTLDLSAIPASARCATAPSATSGAALTANPAEAIDRAPLCTGTDLTPRRAHFYTVAVPAGQRVSVTATRGRVRLLAACGAATCLDGRVDDATGQWTAWTNTGTASATVILALSSDYDPDTTPVGATVVLGPPSDAGRCATAVALTSGTLVPGQSTALSDESAAGCGTDTLRAPAVYYQITVPAGQRLQVSARGTGVDSLRLAARDSCAATSCLSTINLLSTRTERVMNLDNAGTTDRPVRVVISGPRTAFDLVATLGPIPASAACATAPFVTAGTTLAGERYATAGQLVTTCSGASDAAVLYRAHVPAGQRLDVTANAPGSYPLVRVLAACTSATCLGASVRTYTSLATARFTNDTTLAQDVYIAVSNSDSYYTGATFDLTTALVTPPANAACAGATALTPGVAVTGRSEDMREAATTCAGATAPALFYAVDVPAGQRVRVVATGTGLRPVVRVLAACGAATCLGTRYDTAAVYTNAGTASQRVLVAVSKDYLTDGAFTVTATLETPADNGRCAAALAVTPDATLTNQRGSDAADRADPCDGSSATYPALYYSVTVPAGQRLTVRPTATSGSSTRAPAVFDRCSGACMVRSSTYSSTRATSWVNPDAASATVLVAVPFDTYNLDATIYSVGFTAGAVDPGGLCSTAVALTLGAATTVATSTGGQSVPSCDPTSPGPPLPAAFHTVTVPAGRTLRVVESVASYSSYATLRAFTGCAALTACVATGTRDATGNATLTWTNSGTADQTLVITSGWRTLDFAPTTYVLTASLSP